MRRLALVLLLASLTVSAQSTDVPVLLTWPTQELDGTAIPLDAWNGFAVRYGFCNQALYRQVWVAAPVPNTSTVRASVPLLNVPDGRVCAQYAAVLRSGHASPWSNQVIIPFGIPTPGQTPSMPPDAGPVPETP